MPSWYESLFDERYFRFYPEVFDLVRAEREASFIDRALGLPRGARILDLGCGFGRHAVPLGMLGYRMTGVDLSAPMLAAARKLAEERRVEVEWVERDMRALGELGTFDACVCLYTVFGFFDEADNEAVIRAIAERLAVDAPLLIDVSNPLSLLPSVPGEHWSEGRFGVRRERNRYESITGRVITERTLFRPNGEREELPPSSVRLYPPCELRALLERHGLVVEALYGALADEPFIHSRSPKIVMLARRSG